jgi:hypothetical protein
MLSKKEKECKNLLQDKATAHTPKHSMEAFHEIFGERVTIHGLWLSCLPCARVCGGGGLKQEVHTNNLCTIEGFQNELSNVIYNITEGKLQQV